MMTNLKNKKLRFVNNMLHRECNGVLSLVTYQNWPQALNMLDALHSIGIYVTIDNYKVIQCENGLESESNEKLMKHGK